MKIRYKKINPQAVEPIKGSEYAAGLDLCACIDRGAIDIPAGGTVKVGTGIAVEIPEGYFGAIFARSGLATKRGLRPANCVGVIDADYRGELIVALHNDSAQCETIHIGDRIAQLVIMPYLPVHLEEVDELSDTVRGTGGFGSTGVSTTSSEYEQLSFFTM